MSGKRMDARDLKEERAIDLRRRAEATLQAKGARLLPKSFMDAQRLLHELEVHQIELELQNAELVIVLGELELRVAERTRNLATSLSEQEAFSYSVAHDLRAPLRHINSFASMILEDCEESLSKECKDHLGKIQASSQRMGKIIDGLLDLSCISRTGITKVTTDLSKLATEIVCNLQQADPNRHVTFRIEPHMTALGDKTLLEQLLVNLLGNAWKYTASKQSATIEFGKKNLDNLDVFFVKDTGVGFDMAYQDKLFGAFQRLHGTDYEGIGIGLAIVKRIIDRHSGMIWAYSIPNEGATFYFTLDGQIKH